MQVLQQQLAQLQEQVQQLAGQQAQLQQQLQQARPGPAPAARPAPPIENITYQLKRHPSLPYYPSRPLNQIQRVIIHHTAIPPTFGADRIATYRVDNQGWPGIGYHYFITPEGVIQQTNELTTVSNHAGDYNPAAIGVCLAGDFTKTVPTPAQIEAGAQLVAWLMGQFSIPAEMVSGYKELVNTQSPGQQLDTGQKWGEQFRQRIQAYL